MSYCDILLIIRGYRRRNILQYQLERITAYSAFFATRENGGKTPSEWMPLYLDDYIMEDDTPHITPEEQQKLQEEMDRINANGGI